MGRQKKSLCALKLEADPISPQLLIYTARRGRDPSDCNSFQLTCSLRPGPVPPPCVFSCNSLEAMAHGHAGVERHPHAGRAAQLLMRRGAATNSATPLKGPMADVQTALTQARLVPPRAAPASPQLLSRSRIHSGASATRVQLDAFASCELQHGGDVTAADVIRLLRPSPSSPRPRVQEVSNPRIVRELSQPSSSVVVPPFVGTVLVWNYVRPYSSGLAEQNSRAKLHRISIAQT